jgi:Tfp pilus assembly PilM family ATPase
MLTKTFFKLFPPPKFLNIPYAGLDISDDAVRIIEFRENIHGYAIHQYGTKELSPGIVDSGNIKNEVELINIISTLASELNITNVRASLPEERMYLFRTEVPTTNEDEIRQNIEFKLEENVPLSPTDALFFFDMIPSAITNGKTSVSVSVAPRELVDTYMRVINSAGLNILAFEIQPKAIAQAVVKHEENTETQIIIHSMNKKTGIYIVCGGVVCFTSTIALEKGSDNVLLQKELSRVYSYWLDYGKGAPISRIILSGCDAIRSFNSSHISPDHSVPVEVAKVWQNVFSNDHYIPPIKFEDSLEYAVAAGLALP